MKEYVNVAMSVKNEEQCNYHGEAVPIERYTLIEPPLLNGSNMQLWTQNGDRLFVTCGVITVNSGGETRHHTNPPALYLHPPLFVMHARFSGCENSEPNAPLTCVLVADMHRSYNYHLLRDFGKTLKRIKSPWA